MSSDLLDYLEGIILLLFIVAPLTIQMVLYPLGRLCLKKIPAHAMYWLCFVVNTILLSCLNSQDPAEMEPFYASDRLILTLVWAPWYIGVLIWAIGKSIIAAKSKKNEESTNNVDEIAIAEDSSEIQ